ncbi:TlpA family protein disulfide reductase [Niastella sp. OAS944]|uniref:TlpA family protein disulfide reductase n=1 Tax=Niastella sp. OAS944 TaxID=2664089 RepID=UPI003488A07E|nr:thiol-disulfide isomerase/thioredoxin [Chitinophagaceae bacterium OAS944]
MRISFMLLLFSIVLHANAQVEVHGTAKNYKDSVFYITENGGFHNLTMAWRDNRVKVTIDKNGNFKASVPEEAIGQWSIKTGKNSSQSFDLVKGHTLELTADFSKEKPLQAIGKNAADFNYSLFINEKVNQYNQEENHQQKSKPENFDSVLARRKAFLNFKMTLLAEYRRDHHMSNDYYRWLSAKYTYEPFERMVVENIKTDSIDEATVSKIMEKGFNDEYAALHTVEYNDLIGFYIRVYLKKNSKGPITLNDRFSVAADGNLLKGNTRDVYLTRLLASMIKVPDSIYNPLFSKYDKIVHNKQLKQSVISRRYDYTSPAQTSVLSSAASLGEIFGKYKGKVIYVDFWASWCVPCRNEMPNSAELKKNLKGKDIVFIYLGYKDQEKAWLNAREQLGVEGEHYLLNEALIREADSLFGVVGIPHYAIIDRNGNIINKKAGRPGAVYKQLLNLLQQ